MKKHLSLFILLALLSACAHAPAPTPTTTLTPAPTATPTLEPTATPIPSPTPPTINQANFSHPVGEDIPMYNFYDLDPAEGKISSNAGKGFSLFTAKCKGNYFIPGQMDNHYAYDYGAGRCGADIDGYPVYGMSIGFDGIVIDLYKQSEIESKGVAVSYGLIKCVDGNIYEILINFYHVDPALDIGDIVNANTVVAYLDDISYEVEIQVHSRKVSSSLTPIGHFDFTNPQLIGLDPRLK